MKYAQHLVLGIVMLGGLALAADTLVDLSKVKGAMALQQVNATITVPGKATATFEMGKYVIVVGRLEWMIDKSFDASFEDQKKIDLEFFESKKVLEQKPNLVIYQSGFMGSKSVRFLMYKNVAGGVFCRTRSTDTTLAEVKTMIKACETLAAKK